MYQTLRAILLRFTPSMIAINNCIELIDRSQKGLAKYGVTLDDAKLTHEQVLQHLLEEQLDAANYTRKALLTSSTARLDYALLRKAIEEEITALSQLHMNSPAYQSASEEDGLASRGYAAAMDDARERLKNLLLRFDSAKLLRDLR